MGENFLFLVRHGRTVMNSQNRWQGRTDSPLTDEGIVQIKKVSEKLISSGARGIYSSGIQRAITSARIISAITGIPVKGECDGLNERNLGKLEKLTSDEIRAIYGIEFTTITSTEIEKIEGVEKWADFVNRIFTTLNKIRSREDGNLILVTHGGVLRAVYNTITGENIGRVLFDNGHYLKISRNGDAWKIDNIF